VIDEQGNNFPRNLTSLEEELLFYVLPDNKPGYKKYRDMIGELAVGGRGEFGENNLVLCTSGTEPDRTIPSAPVLALGSVIYKTNRADIVIHEETDNQIEFEISFEKEYMEGMQEITRWSYSEWLPGNTAPGDGSLVREVDLGNNNYILAVAPEHKKIWVFERETGVNYIIPVSNLYSYLMLVKNIKQKEIALKPALFYSSLETYSNEELKTAFIAYNKYFKRLKIKS
jgi:hypothetical protein